MPEWMFRFYMHPYVDDIKEQSDLIQESEQKLNDFETDNCGSLIALHHFTHHFKLRHMFQLLGTTALCSPLLAPQNE